MFKKNIFNLISSFISLGPVLFKVHSRSISILWSLTLKSYDLFFIIFLETSGIASINVIQTLKKRIRGNFSDVYSLPEIRCATSLAHHGLLDSVDFLDLRYDDLSSVPTQHLASLVSCVTERMDLQNIRGYNLVTLFDSLRECKMLWIESQSLGREETQAMVRAMETQVEEVELYDVTLDIEALTEYSGQGRCTSVVCLRNTVDRYSEALNTWTTSRTDWMWTKYRGNVWKMFRHGSPSGRDTSRPLFVEFPHLFQSFRYIQRFSHDSLEYQWHIILTMN